MYVCVCIYIYSVCVCDSTRKGGEGGEPKSIGGAPGFTQRDPPPPPARWPLRGLSGGEERESE